MPEEKIKDALLLVLLPEQWHDTTNNLWQPWYHTNTLSKDSESMKSCEWRNTIDQFLKFAFQSLNLFWSQDIY